MDFATASFTAADPRNTLYHPAIRLLISSSVTAQDPDNPLDNLFLRLLPAFALLAALSPLLPRTFTPIPPFVSQEEAIAVAKERIHRIEERTGRSVQFDNEGFNRQSKRIKWFLAVATAESLGWSVIAGDTFNWATGGTTALVWLSLSLKVLFWPPQTPPLAILVAVVLLLLSSICGLLQYLPRLASADASSPTMSLLLRVADLALTATQLGILLAMPMAAGGWEANVDREERERLQAGIIAEEKEDIGENYELCPTTPEDYCSLASTLTYRWMAPIQRLSLQRPLLPSDLWRLRNINDTRLLYSKFRATARKADAKRRGLAARIIRANARDVTLDAAFKVCGVTLAYAGPAFMREILEAIGQASDNPSPTTPGEWTPRERAFVLALAALVLSVIRYVAELLNFHFARQVGLRIRSVMVAELFEKALKRRDMAGAVAAPAAQGVDRPAGKEAAAKAESNGRKGGITERITTIGNRLRGAKSEHAKDESKSSRAAVGSADVGKVVNMMSSDVNVLLRMGCDLHQLYGAPAEVLIATIFLYRLLGWSALAGFSLLILATPLNYVQGRRSVAAQRDWKRKTDRRMGLVAELLGATRFIKLQGIASQWKVRILDARRKEIKALLRVRFAELGFTIIFAVLPIGVSLFSFFCYIKLQGHELTVPTAFTAVTLFAMVRTPLNTIPAFAMATLNALVSIRRLESYLEEDEVDSFISALGDASAPLGTATIPRSATGVVKSPASEEPLALVDATCSWSAQADLDTGTQSPVKGVLRDIDVAFPAQALSVIAGPTGSGKSTLLHALLGELKLTSGTLHVPKWVNSGGDNGEPRISGLSYAAQSPWIEGGKSIKQNILFNNVFDRDRYDLVLQACALLDDLALFDERDETRVSSTTLSGGQQARIGLARALYAPSHTVLLDDPLAAVDAHVQLHIITNALAGPIAQGRRIVLVTHHVSVVLGLAKYVVFLKDGKVHIQGDVATLRADGRLIGPLAEKQIKDDAAESSGSSATLSTLAADAKDDAPVKSASAAPEATAKPARLLYQLEKRRQGAVKFSYCAVYLRASSPVLGTIIVLLTVGLRLVSAGEQYWLKVWGEASGHSGKRTGFAAKFPEAEGHEGFYLGVYGLIGLSIIVLGVVKTLIFWLATLRASQRLYVKLLTSVLGAKLRFFETNPLGRVLQRFNQDVSVMDSELPGSSVNFLNNSMALVGYLTICAVIVPWFLVPAMLFFLWGPGYVRGFLACTRDMQRIESTSTSPLYTSFATSMAGITTIRAFGAERFRLEEMLTILDVTQAQWWAICTIEVWLSFRSQIFGGVAVFLASTLALAGAVSAGSAGMVMTSAQLLTQLSAYLTNDWKHLSNNLNSIERIAEYFDLPSEHDVGGVQPPAAWPTSSGTIHIDKLRLSYDGSLPDVLHDVSLDIGSCAKVGIVGRTGSGKTTLASALFRALEAKSGRIIIDGIDISTLDVDALRRRICIVPQSPVLFSGTVRRNLDPFDERADEECIWALRKVRVKACSGDTVIGEEEDDEEGFVPVMTLTLDSPVAAGGANFSAGEAQLISLARALLRDARLVVLDEATSSTDGETDAAIQSAVRSMTESTVITVAHRLQTVLDYDKVLVLSQGRVLEYDSPAKLLAKEAGEFRKMCEASGIRAM